MKVLVTGFDPFGEDKVNPAFEAVKLLPEEIAGAEIVKLEVPTVFGESSEKVAAMIHAEKPDIVICVGQAGGRASVSFEHVAINLIEARIADNKGNQPLGQAIQADGKNAYFTSLPLKAMVKNASDHGLPAYISYSAGTFVCNEIMYNLLYTIEKNNLGIKGGFIHVPFEPSQTVGKAVNVPSMSIEIIAKTIEYGIAAAVMNNEDIELNLGTIH
ncbi:pyroglutamyl-peptidase I [Enterococcus sp. HY326]|uniref:pyroglutamyl-peptidase I n=1 Tax=Enterococcus sp. HY326 TaxID=2971265 RepID=UPI002240E128|nr:pyroglutamyl-peptidase I [Enterococcus sp. HY326]